MSNGNKLRSENNKPVENKVINQYNFSLELEFSIMQKNLKWVTRCEYI